MYFELYLLIISPFVGSFLASCAHRLPLGISIISPRSFCDHCGSFLKTTDLIPVVSFLLLKGKCRKCKEPFGAISLIAEIAAIGVVILSVLLFEWPESGLAICLGWLLVLIAMIDFEHFILPDILVIVLAVGALIDISFFDEPDLESRLIGAALGCSIFWGISKIYEKLRGRRGLGFGDVKFVAAAGLWLGWQDLPTMIVLAGILGIMHALLLTRKRNVTLSTAIPLGTWMAVALWAIWLKNHG